MSLVDAHAFWMLSIWLGIGAFLHLLLVLAAVGWEESYPGDLRFDRFGLTALINIAVYIGLAVITMVIAGCLSVW